MYIHVYTFEHAHTCAIIADNGIPSLAYIIVYGAVGMHYATVCVLKIIQILKNGDIGMASLLILLFHGVI